MSADAVERIRCSLLDRALITLGTSGNAYLANFLASVEEVDSSLKLYKRKKHIYETNLYTSLPVSQKVTAIGDLAIAVVPEKMSWSDLVCQPLSLS